MESENLGSNMEKNETKPLLYTIHKNSSAVVGSHCPWFSGSSVWKATVLLTLISSGWTVLGWGWAVGWGREVRWKNRHIWSAGHRYNGIIHPSSVTGSQFAPHCLSNFSTIKECAWSTQHNAWHVLSAKLNWGYLSINVPTEVLLPWWTAVVYAFPEHILL